KTRGSAQAESAADTGSQVIRASAASPTSAVRVRGELTIIARLKGICAANLARLSARRHRAPVGRAAAVTRRLRSLADGQCRKTGGLFSRLYRKRNVGAQTMERSRVYPHLHAEGTCRKQAYPRKLLR